MMRKIKFIDKDKDIILTSDVLEGDVVRVIGDLFETLPVQTTAHVFDEDGKLLWKVSGYTNEKEEKRLLFTSDPDREGVEL